MPFDGFDSFDVPTQTSPPVTIHGVKSRHVRPGLPALLLLHGFPQTHHIWRSVVQSVGADFNVIAIDLRGYGESSTPSDLASYAKSAMARDCVAVMEQLGLGNGFFVCAHDRGARVAHKLCVDHPDRIQKVILLDICPTLAMYTSTDFEFAKSYFHWFFLIQKEPLPETLISQSPRKFAELFMGGRQADGLSIFLQDQQHQQSPFDRYVNNLATPNIVHAMCQDYRASASLDLDEAREDIRNGKLIQCPAMVLWGRHGVIEKCFDAVREWEKVTDPSVSVQGRSVDSGHYIPEQAPGEVVRAIREFFL
jgi:pimeloyl-ACP methyl ester carboxylesterase